MTAKIKGNLGNIKNLRVLIMGLGLHGGGAACARWFLEKGANVRITDLKSRKELMQTLLKIPQGAVYHLGGHFKEDFQWADVVVQNPGVPRESSFLALARRSGARIENEASLFFRFVGRERIIGVTGTRGKSTTAALLHYFLKKKYPGTLFGGNIATSPMFEIIERAKATQDPVVLELSSWHLENLGEHRLSPSTAVITNLLPDHMNRYSSMQDYGDAKKNIFLNQKSSDSVVLNRENTFTRKFAKMARSKIYWFGKLMNFQDDGAYIFHGAVYSRMNGQSEKIISVRDIRLQGEHNLENILAAVLAARIYGVPASHIALVLRRFGGLLHRQEFVRRLDGVTYINDSSATTPDAALAALCVFGKIKKNVILIAGGSDKGIFQEKFLELAKKITETCKLVILFDGIGSERIFETLKPYMKILHIAANLKKMVDAVAIARVHSKRGDVVLLSPACASFGLFQNEFDRGEQFRNIVRFLL